MLRPISIYVYNLIIIFSIALVGCQNTQEEQSSTQAQASNTSTSEPLASGRLLVDDTSLNTLSFDSGELVILDSSLDSIDINPIAPLTLDSAPLISDESIVLLVDDGMPLSGSGDTEPVFFDASTILEEGTLDLDDWEAPAPYVHQVMRVTPLNDGDGSGADVKTKIVLTFTEDITHVEFLENSIGLQGPGNPSIQSCEIDGYRLICTPSPLPVGQTYTIVINEGSEEYVEFLSDVSPSFTLGSHWRGELLNNSRHLNKYPSDNWQQSITRNLMQGFIDDLLGPGVLSINYRFSSYRLTCRTVDTDGNFHNMSGLLSFPTHTFPNSSVSGPFPMISLQHGTIQSNAQAPSQLPQFSHPSQLQSLMNGNISVEALLSLFMAADGYIVATPDYLGYGDSSNLEHPYLHAESLATASIDFLRCAQLFLSNKGVSYSDDLYLGGYSEGGFATMAMHQMIQSEVNEPQFPSTLIVKASAPGAGPFHFSRTIDDLMNSDDISGTVGLLEFWYNSYNELYGASFDLPTFNSILDPSGARISDDFRNTYNGGFAPALSAGAGANNIYDWQPAAPTMLYQAEDDPIVPFYNAEDAYEAMSSGGSDVSLQTCTPADRSGNFPDAHTDCAIPYIKAMLNFFRSH